MLSPLGYSHLEGRATQPIRALSQATAAEQNARQWSGNSGERERGREREREGGREGVRVRERKARHRRQAKTVLTKAE